MTLPPRRKFPARKRDSEPHKKFIRLHECAVYHNPHEPCDIDHKIECAHVRSAANSGMGKKPGDEWLVPLCRTHHRIQHDKGQFRFEREYAIDLKALALEFAAASPDRAIREAAKFYTVPPRI